MKKFDISTDDLDGRIEWYRRFDDALKEIISDLHKAVTGERWSKSSLMVLDTKVVHAKTDDGEDACTINVRYTSEYGSCEEWYFEFPSFLLDYTPERYSRYMEWFRDEALRKYSEQREKDERESAEGYFNYMAKSLVKAEEYFKDPENARKLEEWRKGY